MARTAGGNGSSGFFGAAKKILEQIGGLLDARTDSLQAREIKDLSLAFSKVLGCVHGITPGGQQAVAVSDEGGLLTEGRQLSAQILFNSDTSDQYE